MLRKGIQKKFGREKLDFDLLADFADQADELGFMDIMVQGGELLINTEEAYRLIECLKPERFEISLATNGWLLTEEVAKRLAEVGVDNVGISLSTLDETAHDESRGREGSHKRALEAMDHVEKAGMLNWPNAIVGHDNVNSTGFEQFLEAMDSRGALTFLNFAMPYGDWYDNGDVIMTDEDMERLAYLRKRYHINMDWWEQYDKKKEGIRGCECVNRIFLTPLGDVLACPYVHIKIGNIKEQTLKEIIDYGFAIKYFNNYSRECLAARDMDFRERFLKEERDIFHPLDAREIFTDEDYIKDA